MQKQLRKSEIKDLNKKLKSYDVHLSKKDKVIINDDVIEINNIARFFLCDEIAIPLLNTDSANDLKKITVDMGAVKFVASGADIMRPGIVDADEKIEKDEPVAIVDENNRKVIAIGIALFSGKELLEQKTGKVVRNIHFPGDKFWNYA